jgi:hypothetical protein
MRILSDNLSDLLAFAKAYRDLGDAVQSQLDDILDGNFDEVNPNAIRVIKQQLGGCHNDIDDAIREYFDTKNATDATASS